MVRKKFRCTVKEQKFTLWNKQAGQRVRATVCVWGGGQENGLVLGCKHVERELDYNDTGFRLELETPQIGFDAQLLYLELDLNALVLELG